MPKLKLTGTIFKIKRGRANLILQKPTESSLLLVTVLQSACKHTFSEAVTLGRVLGHAKY